MKRYLIYAICLFSQILISANEQNPKVAIIGGGLSGLTAGHKLTQAGIDVEIFEAKERVGGRVLSAYVKGVLVELGGQSLSDGGSAATILSLADEFGIGVIERMKKLNLYYCVGGEKKLIGNMAESLGYSDEELSKKLAELSQKSTSMQDIIDALFDKTDDNHQIASSRLAIYEGSAPSKLSVGSIDVLEEMLKGGLSTVHQNESCDDVFTIKVKSIDGGNARLPLAIANRLGNKVHLKYPLKKISKNDDGSFTLFFKNQKSVIADIVLLTVPLPLYQEIEFEEEVISKKRLDQIQLMSFGSNAKIFLPFKSCGNKNYLSSINSIAFNGRTTDAWSLYFCDKEASFDKETIQQAFKKQIPFLNHFIDQDLSKETVMFAKDQQFESYDHLIGFSFVTDPYTKGSYSTISPLSEALQREVIEIDGERVRKMFTPISDSIYFAGEHTTADLDIIGTMEAACESGAKAARMIQRQLEK